MWCKTAAADTVYHVVA